MTMSLKRFVFAIFICLQSVVAYSQNDEVIVEIIYNSQNPNEIKNVKWFEGITALQALQECAKVLTYNVSKYVFVGAINDIQNKKGDQAWFYKVNGQYGKITSFTNIIAKGDTVTWIYKKDDCPLCEKKK